MCATRCTCLTVLHHPGMCAYRCGALDTLASQAAGSGNYEALGPITQRATLFLLLHIVPIAAFFFVQCTGETDDAQAPPPQPPPPSPCLRESLPRVMNAL
jgi:hypothetical protein